MAGWLIRRTLFAFATAWAISMLSFLVIQIPPGDYVTSYIAQLQSQGTIFTDVEAQALRDLYGLDQPVILQYFRWLGLMAQGNFGVSFEFNRPVLDVIGDRGNEAFGRRTEFYRCLSFQSFQDRPERMFITIGTIRSMFGDGERAVTASSRKRART